MSMILPNPPRPGEPVRAEHIKSLIEYCRAITPRSSAFCRVSTTSGGTTFQPVRRPEPESPGGEGVDWSKIMFGYKVNPDGDNPLEVRIYAGRIASIVVAQADVVLPGADGDYYVYVRRAKSNDSTSVMSGADWPDDDATYAYYILHQFEVEAGVAGIKTVIRPLARDKMQVDKTGLQYQVLQIDAEGAVTVDWLRAGP